MKKLERLLVCVAACVSGCAVDDEGWRSPEWRNAVLNEATDGLTTGDESGAGEADGTVGDAPPPVDVYPESGECGYRRDALGKVNGHTLWGEPILEQNACGGTDLCGRPSLDTCTDQEAAHFTCGCVPAATACNSATLAAGLASLDYHVRADTQARALDCCRANDFPKWIDGLGTAVDALQPASPEAAQRWEDVYAACTPTCAAMFSQVSDPNEGPSFTDPVGCSVTRACPENLETKTTINHVNRTCTCVCVVPVPAK
jgi:hypothetical protein